MCFFLYLQAAQLQDSLLTSHQEQQTLRGQTLTLQHQVTLLGGNLNGHLSQAQGSVVSELQQQLADRESVIAASEAHLASFQWKLERLSQGFGAQLASEQQERQRLGTEAAQARLLAVARGRQVQELQREVADAKDAAAAAAAASEASRAEQQREVEGLRRELAGRREAVAAADERVGEAVRGRERAEGLVEGLRQQVAELQGQLRDQELQVEWLEGKVADLEGGAAPAGQPKVRGGSGSGGCRLVVAWVPA